MNKRPYPYQDGYFDNPNDVQPDTPQRHTITVLGLTLTYLSAIVMVLLTLVALIVGGVALNHWIDRSDARNDNTITHQGPGYQNALISQERDTLTGLEQDARVTNPSDTLKAQISNKTSTFCIQYDNITVVPTDLHQAHSTYCKERP